MEKVSYRPSELSVYYTNFQKARVGDSNQNLLSTYWKTIEKIDKLYERFGITEKLVGKDSDVLYFYINTPSDKSFFIFGGLYDPETGYLNAVGFKNRLNVPIFNIPLVLSGLAGKIYDLTETNRLLQRYKLNLDLPKMIDDIRNHSKTNKSSLSTIKRHFVEGKFIPPFDILKDNSDDDPYLKYLIWMTNLVEGNIYVFNLLLNFYLGNKAGVYNTEWKTVVGYGLGYTSDSTDIPDYLNNSTSRSFVYKFLLKDRYNISVFDKEDLIAMNILDLIPDNDLVYSSDSKEMLKKYQLDKLLDTQEEVDLVSKSLDKFMYSEETIMSEETSRHSYKRGKITATDSGYTITFISMVKDITFINKCFRKVKL